MAYKFTFPFEPPWEALKRTVETPTGTVYIFDSCVVRDPEQRAAIDKQVGTILARAEEKRLLRELEVTA